MLDEANSSEEPISKRKTIAFCCELFFFLGRHFLLKYVKEIIATIINVEKVQQFKWWFTGFRNKYERDVRKLKIIPRNIKRIVQWYFNLWRKFERDCWIFIQTNSAYITLREKCPYSELFFSAFSRIPTEYGEIYYVHKHWCWICMVPFKSYIPFIQLFTNVPIIQKPLVYLHCALIDWFLYDGKIFR